jgi:AraC-like DNA-binding protein
MGELEPTLPAAHALNVAELVERWNVSGERLMRDVGLLSKSSLSDPDARISLERFELLVERARVLTGEPGLGVPLGLQMRVSVHGYLGFAAMTAATLREAIQLACEFAPSRSSVFALRLEERGAEASLILEEKHALARARDAIVISMLVGLWKIGGTLTGRELGGAIDFRFAKPAYFERFKSSMPGEVRFSQPEHRLRFDPALLGLPLAQADPIALKLAREHCERDLRQIQELGNFVARVGPLVLRRDGGYRSAEELAEALHTSARTLKRRLKEQGTSYSQVLERARCAKAKQLLFSGMPIAQIAAVLGYSDAANFTRAFRRWTGRTPAASRALVLLNTAQ